MIKQQGFTLIEVIIFIIVTGILANTILLAITSSAAKMPKQLDNTIATQTARQCIEWFIGQRRLQWNDGYASISCPSTTVPSFCSSPTGYTLSVNVSCTTINSDTNYKTITVTVTGTGNATLSALIADY